MATHPYQVLRRPRRYAFEAMGTNAGAWKDNARSQFEAESAMGERGRIERSLRSVHREPYRPQGGLHPLKHIQPRKR